MVGTRVDNERVKEAEGRWVIVRQRKSGIDSGEYVVPEEPQSCKTQLSESEFKPRILL